MTDFVLGVGATFFLLYLVALRGLQKDRKKYKDVVASITLTFDKSSYEDLQRLKRLAESSEVETVRKALSLYESMLRLSAEGNEILIRGVSGTLIEVEIV